MVPAIGSKSRLLHKTIIAPMLDVTTLPFLELCSIISPHSKHAYYSEMFYARALIDGELRPGSVKYKQNIPINNRMWGKGLAVQIGTDNPKDAYKAVEKLVEAGVNEVNLNIGCPSDHVQSGNFGAILMKTPEKVGDICKAMKEAAGDSAEISVKFRVGVDEEENLDFISRFLDMVSTKSSVTKYVLHARRAWLKGLSPKQNRTVPPLNYDLVYETVKKYPEFIFIGNGGVETTEGVVEKLEKLDGVMIGRKIMHDPWFLQVLDREIYGIDESLVPTEEQVMSRYLDYADMLQKTVGTKNTILAKPMFLIYKGNKGRFFRGQLGQLISKVSGKRYVAGGIDKGDSLWGAESEIHGHPLFSTLVNETLHLCNKQFEHIKARKETSAGITSIH